MENDDIITKWKTQDTRIEEVISINKKLLQEVLNMKAGSSLRFLKRIKGFGIAGMLIWLLLLGLILGFAIKHYSPGGIYFILSVGMIFLINLKGLYDYIRHLAMADAIRYDGNVIEIQEQLSQLQLSLLNHARFMVLQAPFWTTFYLNGSWFPSQTNTLYIVIQSIITVCFVWLAVWLYRNMTMENIDRKWVQKLIEGSGINQVKKALNFYREIEQYKVEN